MTKQLLLEIGMEEVPARFIRGAAEQLGQKLTKWLTDSRISFSTVQLYATPRRMAVMISNMNEQQTDLDEEVKGPSLRIAQDEQGQWTKAAVGFMKGQGVTEHDVYVKEVADVQYMYARKSSKGAPTIQLLSKHLQDLIQSMAFPKNMRWGFYELKFIRPIRWMVALFGSDVIPLEITGVTAGRLTKGHRFLGVDTEISSPEVYVERLREQSVIVDIDQRKKMIVQQIENLAADKGWHIAMKEDLLEEVLFLVEYPTILYGNYAPEFLTIPQEVLITSMREHQRYFPVLDKNGQLLPYFVTIRNGNTQALEQVAKGNEKVLRARLSDAKFFYEEDQRMQISDALKRLETIVFHEELGTIGDKVRRIEALTNRIAHIIHVEQEQLPSIQRAAQICKFDLVSQMVYEFPELQGVMGEDYARKLGESEQVARAMNEHYLPRFAGDQVPASIVGAIISIADKMDTIAGCFSIGIIPTGSQDPYALRRQATGIVQILIEHNLSLSLRDLFRSALEVIQLQIPLKRTSDEIHTDMYDFFSLRMKNILSDKVRYDIADAAMEPGIDSVPAVIRKAQALADFLGTTEAKSIVDAFNRVHNLAAKSSDELMNTAIFEEQVEFDLYKESQSIHILYMERMQQGQEAEALQILTRLKDRINPYFDAVMVMTDNMELRQARLALLAAVAKPIFSFADFSRIVWS
ncbi:MAG: glycine--tRNA ligase subunit beta [Paenibacillaceae bacterium]